MRSAIGFGVAVSYRRKAPAAFPPYPSSIPKSALTICVARLPCYIGRSLCASAGESIAMATASTQPRGVYAAVLTPLNQNYEPDPALFVQQCRWLLDNGCDGLAPLGTTGE